MPFSSARVSQSFFSIAVKAIFFLGVSACAQATEWPQEIEANGSTITIYQPQPDSIEGSLITGRSALSITSNDTDSPTFGVGWFSARLTTDRTADLASLTDIRLDRAAWPDSKDTEEQSLSRAVENAFAGTVMQMRLSDITASLAANQKAHESLESINNTPPKIVFREEISVLLLFDGLPRFAAVSDSNYERAVNTAMVVVRDNGNGKVYLTNGSTWYRSADPLGPWAPADSVPPDLVSMVSLPTEEGADRNVDVPAIVTATEPTELVVSSGSPKWTSLDGGKLLYVQNTETPWIRDLDTENVYLQLSGRWFRSQSTRGPWVFVRSDKLPDSFQLIPPGSDIGGVRHSVAGTPESHEAIVDNQIPQTAAIRRDEATLSVEYDGVPEFKTISGTSVSYAVNTGAQVLRINGRFYVADNGVWFVAKSAEGPWEVADSVPEKEIASIPASAPVYNTTHVHVYHSTPEIVYVGYTPGYLWSFNYYGAPVYGTGWYYPPYIGRVYYPRTPSWGFHVGYNPWFGWNYGVSWGASFYRAGVTWSGGWRRGYHPGRCCSGFYGGGYRHNQITVNTGDIHIGRSSNFRHQTLSTESKARPYRHANLYRNEVNKRRVLDQTAIHKDLKVTRPVKGKKNNVYADQIGRVARHDGDSWQLRHDKAWKPVDQLHPSRLDDGRAPQPDRGVKPTRPPAVLPANKAHTRPMVLPGHGISTLPENRSNIHHHTRPAVHPEVGHIARPPMRPSTRPATLPKMRPTAPRATGSTSFDHSHMNRHVQARQRVR